MQAEGYLKMGLFEGSLGGRGREELLTTGERYCELQTGESVKARRGRGDRRRSKSLRNLATGQNVNCPFDGSKWELSAAQAPEDSEEGLTASAPGVRVLNFAA